jgi:hypothetical protein
MKERSKCDKAYLIGTMEDYLDKLLKHDPAGLPLDLELPARENAEVVDIGRGKAWTSVDRVISGFSSADDLTGEVIYFGAVEMEGAPNACVIRLKVRDRKIVQSEIMYMDNGQKDDRKKMFPRDDEGLKYIDDIVWFAEIPKTRRSSREHMWAIVDAYMDGLNVQRDNGRIPFDIKCERYESGLRMTNNQASFAGVLPLSGPAVCGINLPPDIVERIYDRRFFIADEESGIVAVCFALQYSDKAPFGLAEDHAILVYEMFKIVDGKIRLIDANTLHRFPSPYESGFPTTDTTSWAKLPPDAP